MYGNLIHKRKKLDPSYDPLNGQSSRWELLRILVIIMIIVIIIQYLQKAI